MPVGPWQFRGGELPLPELLLPEHPLGAGSLAWMSSPNAPPYKRPPDVVHMRRAVLRSTTAHVYYIRVAWCIRVARVDLFT